MKASTAEPLKAPFPYFGGKRRVASLVWDRLGDVDNFIEPFCGSAITLLSRPHMARIETINDADCMVANFWRATREDPEAVARWADSPVNEADLHARHRWLVLSKESAKFRARMRSDPDYFDTKVAGWWCWGLCCWIGGGWCTAHGETVDGSRKQGRPLLSQHGKGATSRGVGRGRNQMPANPGGLRGVVKRPKLSGGTAGSGALGTGVHSNGVKLKQPMPTAEQCRTGGKGVNGAGRKKQPFRETTVPAAWDQKPELANWNAQNRVNPIAGRPQLADAFDIGRGVNSHGELGTCADRLAWLVEWFGRLRDRLRLTRVCCGHWLRVCASDSVTTRLGTTGIFLDPPYALSIERMHAWIHHLRDGGPKPKKRRGSTNRDGSLYATDTADVDKLVAEVHLYCLERGVQPDTGSPSAAMTASTTLSKSPVGRSSSGRHTADTATGRRRARPTPSVSGSGSRQVARSRLEPRLCSTRSSNPKGG